MSETLIGESFHRLWVLSSPEKAQTFPSACLQSIFWVTQIKFAVESAREIFFLALIAPSENVLTDPNPLSFFAVWGAIDMRI